MVEHHRVHPGAMAASLLPLLAVLATAAPRSTNSQASTLPLRAKQPMEQADSQLQRQGWQPAGDALVDSLDRELSGNSLSSLISCSGTGVGFCQYAYRLGQQQLHVITVPSRDGDGLVHHWLVSNSLGASNAP